MTLFFDILIHHTSKLFLIISKKFTRLSNNVWGEHPSQIETRRSNAKNGLRHLALFRAILSTLFECFISSRKHNANNYERFYDESSQWCYCNNSHVLQTNSIQSSFSILVISSYFYIIWTANIYKNKLF